MATKLQADTVPLLSTAQAKEPIFLVLASGHSLSAAGIDMKAVRSMGLNDIAELTLINAGERGERSERFDVQTSAPMSHVRLAALQSVMVLSVEGSREQTIDFSAALQAFGKLAPKDILLAVEQLESGGSYAGAGGTKDNLYQVLSASEMAERMQCSLPVVYQREAANEFFSVFAPGRKNSRRFPVFMLSDRLDRALLKRVIQAYKAVEASTTLMWSFLRSPQNEFGGLTLVEMLLGGAAPAYAGMPRDKRAAAIMDVVDEELSRVR